jgi:hypothetical protein
MFRKNKPIKLTFNPADFDWKIYLEAWKDYHVSDNSRGEVKLTMGGDKAQMPAVNIAHANAIKHTIENQQRVQQKIIRSILKSRPRQNKESLKNNIELKAVHIIDVQKNDVAFVGYEFICSWDKEHGLGIMTHEDKVISLGGADRSFLTWVAEKSITN